MTVATLATALNAILAQCIMGRQCTTAYLFWG